MVEKKTEDNWKWRDQTGRLVDEQNQRRWKVCDGYDRKDITIRMRVDIFQGELDTVVRDGPNQGRQWSRTVEVKPNGTLYPCNPLY